MLSRHRCRRPLTCRLQLNNFMNMNKLTKTILLITTVAIFNAGFLASTAQAVAPASLTVEFEGGSPLFNKTNFVPGDSITKWIKVTNTSGITQRIAIEAINFTKPVPETDLSRVLMIVIKQGATEIYGGAGSEKTLYQFYDNGETYLSELANNDTAQYDITISFPSDKGDAWQNQTTGFDVVVGFEGTEGGLPLPEPGGSASGGGGGGGGGGIPGTLPPGLTIQKETTENPSTNSVTITWTTSYPASSQVIYALEGESHILDLTDNVDTPPKYGYERTTPEYDSSFSGKVTFHSVTIDGLTPGTIYYYRAVSHGSLAISTEHSFATLTLEEAITKKEQLAQQTGGVEGAAEGGQLADGGTKEDIETNPTGGQTPEPNLISGQGANVEPAVNEIPQTSFGAAIFNAFTLGTGNSWIGGLMIFIIILLLLAVIYYWFKKKSD